MSKWRKYTAVCRACGGSENIPLMSNGRPSGICTPCHDAELSAFTSARRAPATPARRVTPKMAYKEQKARTARAIERARVENISMVEALRREGLVR